MAWNTQLVRGAFERARPTAEIQIYFSDRDRHLWAEDNHAGIRLHYGANSEEIARIEIEFPNSSTFAEFQRPVLKVFFEVVAHGERRADLVEWVLGALNHYELQIKETLSAVVTLNVNSQRITLNAVPNSPQPNQNAVPPELPAK